MTVVVGKEINMKDFKNVEVAREKLFDKLGDNFPDWLTGGIGFTEKDDVPALYIGVLDDDGVKSAEEFVSTLNLEVPYVIRAVGRPMACGC